MGILIVGPGAMGTALGCELKMRGWPVAFRGRRGPLTREVIYRTAGGEDRAFSFGKDEVVPEAAQGYFLSVKAFQLEEALKSVPQNLAPGTPLVSFCNGGVEEVMERWRAARPDLRWRLGVTTVGVSRLGDAHFSRRSKKGTFRFGPLDDGATKTAFEQKLCEAGELFSWSPVIRQDFRIKWLYNTVINTLAAVRRLPRNGDLLADPQTLRKVFDEAHDFAVHRWGAFSDDPDTLYDRMIQLIRDTADNENSMACDVRLGRRTETDFLAGLPAEAGGYPELQKLHESLRSPT